MSLLQSLPLADIQGDAQSEEKLDEPSELPSNVNAAHPRNSDESNELTNELLARRSGLPSTSTHCRFEWRGLNSFIGMDENRKQILFDCSGAVQSGELLAVMGGSGAGKSTLLNLLCGRTNTAQQDIEGEIAINGEKFDVNAQNVMKAICSFVPQSDILCATQTVEEALMFYAALRLPHKSQELQQKRVDYLIEVLGLDKCRHSYIGDEKKRGISGGEKRRVSIAAEILNDVDIIFLDEPTSGLDAYTAARTIKTLKQFCTVSNKIIIATIHQPSIEVFYLFDRLILLSHGQCCFNATTTDVNDYFEQQLRPRTNPADVIVFEVQRNSDEYVEKWQQSALNPFCAANESLLTKEDIKWQSFAQLTMQKVKNSATDVRNNLHIAPLRLMFRLLLKRELQSLYRDVRLTLIRFAQVLVFGVTCGLIYFRIGPSYEVRIRCFFLLSFIPLLAGLVSVVPEFPKQKQLFERENNSRTYKVSVWASSLMLIEIPRELLHMLIFATIVYFMIDLDGNFMHYWIAFSLAALSGGSCGILLGVFARTTNEAAQYVPVALIPLLLFCDALIAIKTMPAAVRWMASLDPLYHILRSLYIIEFTDANYPFTPSSEFVDACNSVRDLTSQYKTEQASNSTFVSAIGNYSSDSEFKAKINEIDDKCSFPKTIDSRHVFERFSLDPNDLGMLFFYTILLCVTLRSLSMLLFSVMHKHGFGWIMKRIKSRISFCKNRDNEIRFSQI